MGDDAMIILELTRDEAELLGTALKHLRGTLGREEADELAEVQALIRKLEAARVDAA